jgi:hypothetical protein
MVSKTVRQRIFGRYNRPEEFRTRAATPLVATALVVAVPLLKCGRLKKA